MIQIGKVVRIQKTSKNGSQDWNGHSALTLDECLLWKDAEVLIAAPTREIAEYLYVKQIICRLLGSEHVDPGVCFFT